MRPLKLQPWEDRLPDPKAIHEGLLDLVLPGASSLAELRYVRAALAAHVAPSHRFRQSLVGDLGEGADGITDFERACRSLFKEAHFQIERQIAERAKVYTRASLQVYVRGPIGPVEMAARWVAGRAHLFSRLVDGRLSETFVETNVAEVAYRLEALRFEPGVLADERAGS